MKEKKEQLNEICEHCGYTFRSHLKFGYYSNQYGKSFPTHSCPGHEGEMDWDEGPGTVFGSTGMYKEDNEKKNDL